MWVIIFKFYKVVIIILLIQYLKKKNNLTINLFMKIHKDFNNEFN
jgi:hypothetical protein